MIKPVFHFIISLVLISCATQPQNPTEKDNGNGINQETYDLTSKPRGVLSQASIERQWNAYKNSSECLMQSPSSQGEAIYIRDITDTNFLEKGLSRVFIKSEKSNACSVGALYTAPAPIVSLNLNMAYGERQSSVEYANGFFQSQSSFVRYMPEDVGERQRLKNAILEWARKKALSSGIQVTWGDQPVDWQVMTLILSIVTATSEITDDLNPEETVIVGKWLRSLVSKVGQSKWGSGRSDNKEYLKSYVLLLWALMVDDQKLTQKIIDIYKNAIHEIRPDGSFPNDSQRGGMGIDYNSKSASSLVLIASLLKQKKDIDLFSYSVDGRSIHNAVEHVVESIRDPSATNKKYAIRCPDSGDRWGSIERPSIHYISYSSGFLLVYASLYPEKPASIFIEERLGINRQYLRLSEIGGGAPLCQFKF